MTSTALVLPLVLFQIQALKSNEKACPYVLVTTAGARIGALDLPKRDGKSVKFRMCVNGTLAMLSLADVDWGATEKANAAGPAPTPASGLAPTPMRPSLSGFAGRARLRDPDEVAKPSGPDLPKTPAPRKSATPTRTPSHSDTPVSPR
jgi:hypothetical protein